MIKKILLLVSFVTMSLIITSCGDGRERLVIANWGEFIDESLVRQFERENNVRVNIVNYHTNHAAIGMIETQVLDLVIPSDYAIEELAARELIQEINWELLSELGLEVEFFHDYVLERLEDLYDDGEGFDYLNYAVPYFWGNLGIVYNTGINNIVWTGNQQFPAFTGTLSQLISNVGWDIFIHPAVADLDISFYDSAQDGVAVALSALERDMNSSATADLDAAFAWLQTMRTVTNPIFAQDDLLDDVPAGRVDIALLYSGCATLAIKWADEGVNLNFHVPYETNFFVNGMVIPRNANNVELAHEFMAFISRPLVALENTLWVHYTSPIQSVFDFLMAPNGVFFDSPSFNPIRTTGSDTWFRYMTGRRNTINTRWQSFLA